MAIPEKKTPSIQSTFFTLMALAKCPQNLTLQLAAIIRPQEGRSYRNPRYWQAAVSRHTSPPGSIQHNNCFSPTKSGSQTHSTSLPVRHQPYMLLFGHLSSRMRHFVLPPRLSSPLRHLR